MPKKVKVLSTGGTTTFFPYDIDSIEVLDGPQAVKDFQDLMATKVVQAGFEIPDSVASDRGMVIFTESGSGGVKDECDQHVMY